MTSMKGKNCSLERMLKMQMKNLFKPALLACAALFALASCSAEQEPQASQNISSGPGEIVKVSLSVAPPTYDGVSFSEPEDATSGAKALGWNDTNGFPFKVVDATKTFVKSSENDGNETGSQRAKLPKVDQETLKAENPTREILMILRKQGNSEYAFAQQEWRYNAQIGAYEIKGVDVTLPASWGTVTASDRIFARVVTGAKFNATNKTLEVDEHLTELDLSRDNTVRAQVPFASDWVSLERDAAGQLWVSQKTPVADGAVHNNRMTFKPLGSLILLSFRNTGRTPVTFSKIRLLTNAQVFAGKYDLTKETLVCTPPDTETGRGYKIYNVTETGDLYREKEISFASSLTLPTQRSPREFNNRVFVLWVAPVAGKKTIGGSLEDTRTAAQTMVFAENVIGGDGQVVRYPNYTISPIMGTNRLMDNGKTYALNCEFYTGSQPLLGYYAQYTVNASGNGFDTSHENSQVSLVHYTKAREFMAGKNLQRPGSTEQNTYYVGTQGSASLLNLLYGVSFNSQGPYTKDATGATEYRGRNAIAFPINRGTAPGGVLSYTIIDNPRNWYYSMISKRVPYDGVAYYVIGRRDGTLSSIWRSNSQAFYRVEAMGFRSGKIEQMRIKSFATGKYFVGGTYTPVYRGKNIMSEDLWTDPTVLQGGYAERYIPAPGTYSHPVESDYELEVPTANARTGVGERTYYWFNTGYNSNYLLAWYTVPPYYSGAYPQQNSQHSGVLTNESWGRPSEAQLPKDFSFGQAFMDAFNRELLALGEGKNPNGSSIADADRLLRQGKTVIGYGGVPKAELDGSVAYALTIPSGRPVYATYKDKENKDVTLYTVTQEDMAPFLWLALLPYSTTYQGDAATVPSHER